MLYEVITVVGLSKIPRIVNVFARRLQIQEQMTEQIADAISETIKPKGVAVVLHARITSYNVCYTTLLRSYQLQRYPLLSIQHRSIL